MTDEPTMSQPRVDLFTSIHKGLRSAMYETGALLERTNFADLTEKGTALESARRTLSFFDEHLALEDQFIAPHVREAADPELANELAEQHEDHAELSEAMSELFDELEEAEGVDAVGLGFELAKLFNVMVADQSYHMNLEERDANMALWEAKTDAELIAIRAELQAFVPPPRFAQWMTLMLASANHQELVGMLSGMKANAPPAVYEKVRSEAKRLLGDRWASIEAVLR